MDTPCGHEGSEGSKGKVDGAPPRGFLRFLSLKLLLHNLPRFQGNFNKPPQKVHFFKVLLPMLLYNRHRFPMNPSWLKAHYYDQ